MRLYEISGAMKNVQEMIDEGVPLEQLEDTIKEIECDFKEKAESILFVISNLNAEIEGCKTEETRLSTRRKSKTNQIDRLKSYLLMNIEELKIGKIDNGIMTASVRKGAPALIINDEDKIPMKFKRISTSVSTDKRELLKALKALEEGETIEGAEIGAGKNSLTIK